MASGVRGYKWPPTPLLPRSSCTRSPLVGGTPGGDDSNDSDVTMLMLMIMLVSDHDSNDPRISHADATNDSANASANA